MSKILKAGASSSTNAKHEKRARRLASSDCGCNKLSEGQGIKVEIKSFSKGLKIHVVTSRLYSVFLTGSVNVHVFEAEP